MAVGSQLNGYLAEVADALFTDAFGNLEDNAVLSDIAKITMGQSPAGTSYNKEGVGTVFLSIDRFRCEMRLGADRVVIPD